MSWSEHFVQNHKRQTDCAIHRAYARLAGATLVLERFDEILGCARQRAPRLFEAPVINGRHLGVDALVNLARSLGSHLRPATDWAGTTLSWRPAVLSLSHHLVCEYSVPAFLASAWYASDALQDGRRDWFIAHSRGASFRSLNLPITMTRKMEHIFLASPDHLQIEYALRRAELLALGVPPKFSAAILATRLGWDLRYGEFWRSLWMFLVVNANEVDPSQIGPMIDYLQAIRHERVPVDTPNGRIELDPPQPDFSMKGRTVQSVLRLMQDWHRKLGIGGASFSWTHSPFRSFLIEEPRIDDSQTPRRWQMIELTNSAQLRGEGAALRHCVASYANSCARGASSIWSLRLWQGEKLRHMLTVEVDPRRCAIVQARGQLNRFASGKPLSLLKDWAMRERLRVAI